MKFTSAHISTSNEEIIEGMEYAYKEGSFKAKVKLLKNKTNRKIIAFTLLVIESNRDDMPAGKIFKVSSSHHNFAYGGMWKLWDVERYNQKMF